MDFFSQTELLDTIDAALDHPERMVALREAARQTIVDHYNVQQSLQRYGQLITQVMAQRDKRTGNVQQAGKAG